ncbi:peptidoglycan-binding protein [Candidatus Kaiserbacteria bacterium]|nr:peptidoglycan-binding protein [Candidatus Kaiserbacteria bacterium]
MRRPCLPIKKGDTGPHIQVLQGLLLALGCTVPPILRGRFAVNTEDGVKELQGMLGLEPTGIFDDELHRALEERGINYSRMVEFARIRAPYYVGVLPVDIAEPNSRNVK